MTYVTKRSVLVILLCQALPIFVLHEGIIRYISNIIQATDFRQPTLTRIFRTGP